MKKVMVSIALPVAGILVGLSIYSSSAFAQHGPANLNISGALFNPGGTPVLNSSVNFKVEILDPSSTCVVYSENHLAQDLSASKGGFALEIGKGSSKSNLLDSGSPAALTSKVFLNNGAVAPFAGCAGGLTLNSGDSRVLRISYDLGSGYVAMTPDVPMDSAAYAMIAESVQGKKASDLIQVRDDATYDLNQGNVESIFSAVNFAKLTSLLSGNVSNQRLTNVVDPTAASDAATKGYADGNVGGKIADVTGVGPAVGDGKTLIWDQAQNKWVTGTPIATDNTKLPLAGGTMTGAIAMGAQNITNIGHMTMAAQKTLNLGTYTDPQETTLVAGLTAADKGKIWFNTTSNTFKVWDGTAAVNSAAPSGAAGGDLTGNYPNPTIGNNKVVAAAIASSAVTTAKVNAANAVAGGTIVMVDSIDTSRVEYKSCALGEALMWTAGGWACTNVATFLGTSGVTAATYGSATQVPQVAIDAQGRVTSASNVAITFPVISVAGKTGVVTLNTGDITNAGTAATKDYGTAAGNLVELDGAGKIPASLLPSSSGDIQDVVAGSGLTGGGSSGAVTLSVDTGTTTGKIVMMAASDKLPAVNGSDLTNVNAVQIQGRDINGAAPGSGDVLTWNNTSSKWEAQAPAAGGGAFVNNGNSFGGAATLGTNDNFALNFEANNSTAMTILANGNVGVGTTSPSSKLSVEGGFLVTGGIAQRASSGLGYIENTHFGYNDFNWGGTYLDLGRSRGTYAAPTALTSGYKLGGIQFVGYDGTAFTAAGTSGMYGEATEGWNAGAHGTNLYFTTTPNGSTTAATRIYISPSGNVGIGTTNPAVKLDIAGVMRVTDICDETGANCKDISSGWGAGGDIDGVYSGTGLTGGFASGSGTLAVDVGTVAGKIVQMAAGDKLPAVDGSNLTNLNVSGSNGFVQNGNSFGAAATLGTNDNFALNFETNNSTKMTLDTSGNVGIGTTNPAAKLDVAGSVRVAPAGLPGSPVAGQIAIDSGASNKLKYYDGSTWVAADGSSASPGAYRTANTVIYNAAVTPGTHYTLDISGVTGAQQTYAYLKIDTNSFAQYQVRAFGSSDTLGNAGESVCDVNSGPATCYISVSTDSAGKIDFTSDSNRTPVVTLVGYLIPGTGVIANGPWADVGGGSLNYAGGNIGIGSSNPAAKLDVAGTIRATDICDETGANCKDISSGWGAGGDIDGVYSGTGLTGGFASGSGTLAVDVGTVTGKIVQVAAANKLPVIDGSNLTNINAVQLQSKNVSATAPTANQVLKWNNGTNVWEPAAETDAFTGTVTSVVSGTGLTGGNITSTGTLAVDVGTTAGKIVQMAAGDKLPAVDGSNLTNLNVSNSNGFVQNGNSFGGAATLGTNDNNALNFETNNATAMTILGNGNVGIGSTNPVSKLDVNGTVTATGFSGPLSTTVGTFGLGTVGAPSITFTGDLNTGWWSPAADTLAASTNSAERIRIDSSGNVGIGTNNPSAALHVASTSPVAFDRYGATAHINARRAICDLVSSYVVLDFELFY
jgi:hypothetical protein